MIRDVVKAEDALVRLLASQDGKHSGVESEDPLWGIRRKGGMALAGLEEVSEALEDGEATRGWIAQFLFQRRASELSSIDPSFDAGGFHGGPVITGAEEGVEINSGHSGQGQHDAVGRKKPRYLTTLGFISVRITSWEARKLKKVVAGLGGRRVWAHWVRTVAS